MSRKVKLTRVQLLDLRANLMLLSLNSDAPSDSIHSVYVYVTTMLGEPQWSDGADREK